MSVDYSIYIRTEKPLSEVKACLEKILNCPMEQSPNPYSEHYYTILLGLGVGLIGPKDEEDYSIEGLFSPENLEDFAIEELHYNYLILLDYLTPSFYGDYRGEWEPTFLIIIADLLYMNLDCESIVTNGTILAKFPPVEDQAD